MSEDCRLITKFPRTLKALLWETHVTTDERVKVRPGKFEEIKQVFAEEIASIFIIAIKAADDISIEGCVSANNKKDFFLCDDCV